MNTAAQDAAKLLKRLQAEWGNMAHAQGCVLEALVLAVQQVSSVLLWTDFHIYSCCILLTHTTVV